MGGAVSSGESNDELVDNLMEADYIKTSRIERVFRAVDRALYYTDPYKRNAYKDVAWKDGNLHLSAPCIYSEVMEHLELQEGLTFLNLGSGTGYLSTMVGLLLGKTGRNHGIELHLDVVDYARAKLHEFMQTSPALDAFDFCVPEFVVGNCLDPMLSGNKYDRIYCGAACPEESVKFIVELLKDGGICVVPIGDSLVQITKIDKEKEERKALLPVSFATLISPREGTDKKGVVLPELSPLSLKELCRFGIRETVRKSFLSSDLGKGFEEKRRKRKKKRQDRRRASRLVVVQRRRSGGDAGETGFVAIAYSVGDQSGSPHNSSNSSSNVDQDQNRTDEEMQGQEGRNSSSQNSQNANDGRAPAVSSEQSSSTSNQNRGEPIPSDSEDDPNDPMPALEPAYPRPRNSNSYSYPIDPAHEGEVETRRPNSESLFRRVRNLYRRREQHRATFRQLINAVSTATNSAIARSGNNGVGSGSSTTEDNGSDPAASGSGPGASRRRRDRRDRIDALIPTSSSGESSDSPTTSDSDYEDTTGHAKRKYERVSTSAESGVGTEESPPEKPKRKDFVSAQMKSRIAQLPLPPPMKSYLNYYRSFEE